MKRLNVEVDPDFAALTAIIKAMPSRALMWSKNFVQADHVRYLFDPILTLVAKVRAIKNICSNYLLLINFSFDVVLYV
jgi:hypothetical protein